MFKRLIKSKINAALARSPVLLLTGARQTGKTTLVKEITQEKKYTYITFDDLSVLSTAKKDPVGFIDAIKKPVILDEVQRIPEIFLTIKKDVDENRIAGRYILTGSANPFLIPALGDSLAGRMEICYLYPLCQSEIEGTSGTILDMLFSGIIPETKKIISKELLFEKINIGGYPVVQNQNNEAKNGWFDGYVTTLLQRDVRDLSEINGITEMPRLLHILAARTANLLNVSELSRTMGIPNATLHRYLSLLQTLFLIKFQLPWSSNIGKRFVKSPKLYLNDTGLLSFLLNADFEKNFLPNNQSGPILENFVLNELIALSSWSKTKINLFHLRTVTGIEIDCILENAKGEIVAIEVKNSSTVQPKDFKNLQIITQDLGEKLIFGIVLYTGNQVISLNKKLHALPISVLWSE